VSETHTNDAAREQAVTMRLVVTCPDRVGIVAAVARFLAEAGANIESSHQYSSDPTGGTFFLRMQFVVPPGAPSELAERFGPAVAERFAMSWKIDDVRTRKRIAVLVSRQDHCLAELLWRWRHDELDGELVLVASNHPDLRAEVEAAGLPYHHIPVSKEDKPAAEAALLALLDGHCDLVVLARYMQVLSSELLERLSVPIINIHHSFLPAFAGAGPYERARERGVKLVGATAHYDHRGARRGSDHRAGRDPRGPRARRREPEAAGRTHRTKRARPRRAVALPGSRPAPPQHDRRVLRPLGSSAFRARGRE
jgi:formyltetrahydrofolate deformylase